MEFIDLKHQIENKVKTLSGEEVPPNDVALSVKYLLSGETININSTQQIWAASVIKIPIACELVRLVKSGKLDFNSRSKFATENIEEGTGIIKLPDRNDEFTLLDLVKLMLAVSDNSATNQIVDLIGWENVEEYIKDLGLMNTTFRHKMMIKAGRGPNLTTSEDILLLLEKLYKNNLPGAQDILEILKQQQDRSCIPLLLPNEVEIAHKTGSLPEATHDVGIVYSKNPFIFVFLSDNQKDKQLTNKILSECAKFCYDYSLVSKKIPK